MKEEDNYGIYRDYFKSLNDKELIDKFNNQVGNPGWTSSRASYLAALHHEFIDREIDCSDIGNSKELSFKNKVILIRNKIINDPFDAK